MSWIRSLVTAAAAAAILAAPAARAAEPSARSGCAFNLPLNATLCAQIGRTRPLRSTRLGDVTGKTLVYASEPLNGSVEVVALGGGGFTPVGTLGVSAGSIPLGLAVDASGNLYVAAPALGSGTQSVDVFPRGATKPSRVYTDGLTGPVDVAVDSHGTLYVANLAKPGGGCAQGSGPFGTIVEYAKGSMRPTGEIGNLPGCPEAVTVDAKGDVYFAYIYYPSSGLTGSNVVKYSLQTKKLRNLNLQAPGGNDFGGLAIDAAGNLVVENDQADATLNQLLVFAPGSKKPSATIQYGGSGWGTSFRFFAMLGTRFVAPAYVSENFPFVISTIATFDYPSGRELHVQHREPAPAPFVYGFAVSP